MHAIDLRVVCILCFHAGKMNGKSILIYSKAAESDALCICTLGPTHALRCVTVCGGKINLFMLGLWLQITGLSMLHKVFG